MPRAKQRTPELRAHILRVATATLANEGVAGFTTRRVASDASTSLPAVYELFGDKGGLVRELFFEGFRQLRARLDELEVTTDPVADLVGVANTFRAFAREHPALTAVMFSRPFADFDPGPEELAAGSAVRNFVVGHIRRCVDMGLFTDDPTDVAHVFLAMIQGLATQESAGWLGSTPESVDRRWELGPLAFLAGLVRIEGR